MLDIDHTQEGNKQAYAVNIGGVSLYFSYNTLIAVTSRNHRIRRENCWGPTTGRHINLYGLRDCKTGTEEEVANAALLALAETTDEITRQKLL